MTDKMENLKQEDQKAVLKREILLEDEEEQRVVLPSKYPQIVEAYNNHESMMWFAHEIRPLLVEDRKQWSSLTKAEQNVLHVVLGFFAAGDDIVNENLVANFVREVKIPEVKRFYVLQAYIEQTHAQVYADCLQAVCMTHAEFLKLANYFRTRESIKRKMAWAKTWMDPKRPFAERVLAFACVEGIFFSSSFATIYYFKKRNKLPGICKANEFIARDEGLHQDFACLLYNTMIVNKLPTERIHQIVQEAVECESLFVI